MLSFDLVQHFIAGRFVVFQVVGFINDSIFIRIDSTKVSTKKVVSQMYRMER